MALRVLTTSERESLKTYQPFIDAVNWAIRDYASYWSIHDGSGLANEVARLKWAKDRILGVSIVLSDVNDQLAPTRFVTLAKGMQLDLNVAPASNADIHAALLAGNKYDELAASYFTLIGESINMSASGN